MNLRSAIADPALFAPWFSRGQWEAWFAFVSALFGLPMSDDELALYRRCTGREKAPDRPFREAWLVVGRRGGKSFIVALIAVFLAAFFDYRQHLQRGERGTILILAADRKQARVIFRYVRALFTEVPMLAELVERENAEGLDLTNRISIEIGTASFRAVRSGTIVAALCDEVAFWRSEESANPDYEILNGIRPGMATIPNAMLLALSSPYARRGELYRAHREFYGKPDPDVLVWQAETRIMNPTVPEHVIQAAYDRDPASAAAEYGAQFRSDIEQFVSRDVVESAIRPGPLEVPRGSHSYVAFVDPAGGGADEFCLAIAHRDGERVVIDVLRGQRGVPAEIVAEYAGVVQGYGLSHVYGDRYGGTWPADEFQRHGIRYETVSQSKSDLYLHALSALNSGRVELPPHDRLLSQFMALERKTSRGGRDSIDHAPGAHDDLANAVAGAIMFCGKDKLDILFEPLNVEPVDVGHRRKLGNWTFYD